MENAKKFIDFIISQEVQDTLGTTTTNRPVRKNAKTSENMKPIDKNQNTQLKIMIMSSRINQISLRNTTKSLQISNLNSKRGSL